MATPLLRIGQVAQRAGVSADTIRYYERLGLLPKPHRAPSGYREYSETIVNRITLVRNAMRFGFSLLEIRGFLRVREAGGKPCHHVRQAAEAMLDRVDQQIAELHVTRDTMRETLLTWDAKLARTPEKQTARLLESLPNRPSPDTGGRPARRDTAGLRRSRTRSNRRALA